LVKLQDYEILSTFLFCHYIHDLLQEIAQSVLVVTLVVLFCRWYCFTCLSLEGPSCHTWETYWYFKYEF